MKKNPKNLMIRYVFETRQNELQRIIPKYGVAPAQNSADLWKKLNYIVMQFPQDALRDIVSIHPDRDIIMKLSGSGKNNSESITSETPISKEAIEKLQVKETTDKKVEEKKANCSGDPNEAKSGCCGADANNATSGCDGGCSCGGKCSSKNIVKPTQEISNISGNETKNFVKDNVGVITVSIVAIAAIWLMHKQIKNK